MNILHILFGVKSSNKDKTRSSWFKRKDKEEKRIRKEKEDYKKTGNKVSDW